MDSTAESRQDAGWWTSVDEGYWQALLEQGMNPDDIFFATRQKRGKKAHAENME